MIGHILGLLLFLSATAQSAHVQEVEKPRPPADLRRHFCFPGGEYLDRTDTRTLLFSWDWDRVTLIANVRAQPNAPRSRLEQVEKVPFFVTAVAPRYYDSLYVIGVREDGVTTIEQWTIALALEEERRSRPFDVRKQPILESWELTHLRAAAADPDGRFLIAQHRETREIWRVSLPSDEHTTLVTPAQRPELQHYDVIQYQQHVTRGRAYLVQGNGGHDPERKVGTMLALWDPDGDGIPDSVEEAGAFGSVEVWAPMNEFYPPYHARRR